ncbi:hypothetical protein LR48_Vigan304s004500 [Vigna angularis]|uniref:Uncharacterized protein n=1 Tax=Phaseolus angularis TaxID=3914 RepID=A0A0L9T7Z4_PHAAN|nr:hypothetical protein LR48_Vigan304s004500 [Vigna angularis]
MTGQGLERPDKGKGVARPKKRQRQAPKYVLRVPARLPTIAAPDTSSVGPSSTPTIQPLTPAVDPTPTSTVHCYNTPAVHPSPTPAAHPFTAPAADPLPPPVIITPTPPPVVLTPTPLPDRTSIPSSSCIPPSETVTSSVDPDSSGDGEGLDPPLHDRPWIEPYARGGTLKHQPSSSTTTPDEVVLRLTQALEQRDQEITDLRAKFTNFKALVMRVLPETSQDEFTIPPTQPRPSLSPAAPQQPTSVQPSSVQPSSVQPTPVQPSIEEQDDEDHSDDNFVHY